MLGRRKWLILTAILLGLLLAAAYTLMQDKTYTATTSVLVKPIGAAVVPSNATSGTASRTGINLDTEAQLVKSQTVSTAAGKLLKSTAPWRQISKNVTITVPPNTTVLDISYDAGSGKGAAAGAEAVAKAYLTYRAADAANAAKLQRTIIQQQVNQLLVQLQTTTAKIASLPSNSPDRALAQATQTSLVSQISAAQGQLAQLAAPSTDVGTVVSAAAAPAQPSKPSLPLNLASGVMLGLLVGLALALFRERADHRIRRGGDVERGGLPLLAEVGATQHSRRGAPAAGYQQLRNVLLTRRAAGSNQVILIAPASDGVSGGTVAVNLAASLLRAGKQVVLLSTTPGSTAARLLQVDGSVGVSDVIEGRVNLLDAVQRPAALPTLQVIASGQGGGSELLATPAFETLVRGLRQLADVVVVEGAPVTGSADTQAVAPAADVVVIVAQEKSTTRDQLAEARHQMELVGTEVLGVVLLSGNAPPTLPPLELAASGPGDLEPAGFPAQR